MESLLYFSDTTSLYIYSALFQGNAAILSIMGVFFIFKIQSLQSDIMSIKQFIITKLEKEILTDEFFLFNDFMLVDKEVLLDSFDKEFKSENKGLYSNPYRWWYLLEKRLLSIKKKAKFPLLSLLLCLLVNTMGLFSASNLHLYHPSVEVKLALFTVLLEVLVLILIVKKVLNILTPESELSKARVRILRNSVSENDETKKE